MLFILKTLGLPEGIGLTEDNYKELIALIFTVAIAFGVFNNPTDMENF